MAREGKYSVRTTSNNRGPIWRETFEDPSTAPTWGTETGLTLVDGVATFDGSTSNIIYQHVRNGVYSIRIKLKELTPAATQYLLDYRKDSGIGYVRIDSGVAVSASSGTVYVDGVPGSTISSSTREITITGITLLSTSLYIGSDNTGADFFPGKIELVDEFDNILSEATVLDLKTNSYYYSNLWSPLWASFSSAVVENAAPTKVVMTFTKADTRTVASDFTVAGFTVSSLARDATNKILTLTLSTAVAYGDVLTVSLRGLTAKTATNNVLYTMLLTSTGTGAGVTTLRMTVSSNITVTLGANAKFYSDAAGTLDESSTWNLTSGAERTIYLKCTTGTALMTFSDITKVTKWGSTTDGWISSTNAARVTSVINKLSSLTQLRITGTSAFTGALPTGLAYLSLNGNSIAWTYNGALPTGLTYLQLNGTSIAWTGLNIGNNGNIATCSLINYRTDKMSSADMITLLTQMTGRTGTLPATVTINDYADYASPPAGVVTAVNALKAAKSITTVNLGA